jgi:hypothetical protein
MLEIECICCGTDLSGRYSHPRPVMNSMCKRCIDEVNRMQQTLRANKGRDLQEVVP